MTTRRNRSNLALKPMQIRYRRAAVTLALAAMMLRALLPMGWMPNPAGFKSSPLVICLMDMQGMSMNNMAMSKSDMPQRNGHDRGQQQNNETCPFAAAPHLAPPALLAVISEPQSAEVTTLHLSTAQASAASEPYTPQSPRAPPSFA